MRLHPGAHTLFAGMAIVSCCAIFALSHGKAAHASPSSPAVTAWKLNASHAKGSSDSEEINDVVSKVDADVLDVWYDERFVYVHSKSVPSHEVGPFNDGNPAVPGENDVTFALPLSQPRSEDPKHAYNGLGAVGVFVNGVTMYNYSDATSYRNQGIWNQNAVVARGDGMDHAGGHPSPPHGGMGGQGGHGGTRGGHPPHHHQQMGSQSHQSLIGQYHYHQQPSGLREQLGDDGSRHSPILGFAFDGVPVYGPYGYAKTNGTGGVRRIESSYILRQLSSRTSLPDGTELSEDNQGPEISDQHPLGFFIEDFKYVDGLGDLDTFNGRFCVTPEYPDGVYAYFATIDETGESAFPYLFGDRYYSKLVTNYNKRGLVPVPDSAVAYKPRAGNE